AVVLAGVLDVRERGARELRLRRAALDELGPGGEAAAQVAEVPLDVVGDAEVDERDAGGRPALDLVDRRVPRVDIDLGRGRRREDVAGRLDAHACSIARIERPVAVQVADVVRGMTGRRKAVEAENAVAG